MLDVKTRQLIATAGNRRQIELSALFIGLEPPPLRHKARGARSQSWTDLRDAITIAIGECDDLRVLKTMKTRPELVLRGTAASWRRFLVDHDRLVRERSIMFREHRRSWTEGLRGFPE
ncbi:MAG: hypothetical protein ACK4FB_01590 [Brevundimonas sp.]|uniref:hypothetical protein n=1 Tax=Brevundimonas sp. TaxID=1871086 RepID=UPI00391DA518